MIPQIHPLTPGRFADFETVLGKSGVSGCWCMYWILPSAKEFRAGAEGGADAPNRAAFRAIVDAGPPPGLIAYCGGAPVAWARVTPRAALPGLTRSRRFKSPDQGPEIWSISCFRVLAGWRGKGLTGALIGAAIPFARDHGARVLEAYANDPQVRKSPEAVYTGLASTFARAGFYEVERRAPDKVLMRRDL